MKISINTFHQAPVLLFQEKKFLMPVSLTQGLTGEDIVISKFGDDEWDFFPYIPQENLKPSNKRIRWGFPLPDGKLFTDSAHSGLLQSAKDFIWSLYASPAEGRIRPKMITLITKFELMQPLIRWMVSVNIQRFSEIGEYLDQNIAFARLKTTGKGMVAPITLASRLNLVEYLYYQREKLSDSLTCHPWPHETAMSISGNKRGGNDRKPSTKNIPDDVTNDLAKAAIDYVCNRSRRILSAYLSTEDLVPIDGLLNQTQTDMRTEISKQHGFKGTRELRSAYLLLRTACYIVIDLFSGIRDSEMMSLDRSCISLTRSSDDTMDVFLLRGTIYKTGLKSKKWIVPAIVKEAVDVLTKLTAPFRERLIAEEASLTHKIESLAPGCSDNTEKVLSKRLHLIRNMKEKIFLCASTKFGNQVSTLNTTKINVDLKDFCLTQGIVGPDGAPYLLHAHQFRRTYARFVARAELGDLLMLRDHFGHWTLDMTMYYVDGALDDFEVDTELLELVSNEKMNRQFEVFSEHLQSTAPVATGGEWLQEWRGAVRISKNKESLIAEYSDTVTLNGTGHSWCVGNSRGTGCGGLCIMEATMCIDCNYGIIGQEHRPIWSGIRDQQLEALALDDMGPGGHARAMEILRKAEKVIRRLDGGKDE